MFVFHSFVNHYSFCSANCPFHSFVNTGIVLGHRVDTAIVPLVTASGLKIIILPLFPHFRNFIAIFKRRPDCVAKLLIT